MSRHTSSSRKISFNVSDQYEIQDVVGEGAYGVVWYASLSVFASSLVETDSAPCFSAQHSISLLAKRLPSRKSHHLTTACSV